MSDENKPAEDQVRKTLSMTHRQAGFTATGIAALTAVLVGPLSQVFQTKLDAAKVTSDQAVQASQIAELKMMVTDAKREILDKISDSTKPIAKQIDGHETRIVNLEFIQMNKGSKNK